MAEKSFSMHSKIGSAAVLMLVSCSGPLLQPQSACAFNSLFSGAVVTRSNIVLSGYGVQINSYNSADTNYSTGGQYDPGKARCNGDVASRFGVVSVGNAYICGTLHLGPTASWSIGPNGVITGGVTNDMDLEIPNVQVPFSSAVPPASGTIGGTNYDYVMSNGCYMVGNLNGSVYVFAGAAASLYVVGNASFASINLQPNATLKVYVGGPSANLSNINISGPPSSFQLWGLSTLNNVALLGAHSFTGTIYAPRANVTLNVGGTNQVSFQGAIVASSFTANGHVQIHYDEHLARVMPGPAILDAPGITNGNQFRFVVAGVPGFNYSVLASTNLQDWVPLVTNTSPFEFLDTDAAVLPCRFFRSVYSP